MDFLSLKALQGGSISFGNVKKGYILGIRKVGKSLTHFIENVYYVNGLKYSLLSVSQICDKGNKVEFLSKICTVTKPVTGEVVLVAKRYNNIYVVDFESLQSGDLSCLKVVDDDAELWHRILGYASFSLLNKLIQKDLVHGLPLSKFKVQKVCDEYARGKHVKSSFKSKKDLGKFYAKCDEGIFLGYVSRSKAYKIYNKQTQCAEESVHVIFDESYPSCEKSDEEDKDGEPLLVPREVIDMTNGKADMMSQVKEPSEDNVASSSVEPGTSITTIEAKKRVVDVVQGTPLVPERRTQENQLNIPTTFTNEPQMSTWKHKSSYPFNNIITPIDSGVQTMSKARYSLAFSAFLSQIKPKNIKEALKDADWITAIQDELHQFERNNVWHLVARPSYRTIIGTRWVFRNKIDKHGNTIRNKAMLVV
ncbi:uncharacterized protein [Nicotiana sylvestris]|uniref:uncharacterized protein n=1 Tax=Nicotiana sylvestris TaxID=4096 RepID=UPI00388CDBDD